MKEVIFREKRLIDREVEIGFIKEWFEKVPDDILWIYGPKSSGKTTLIEYIVEKELFDDFKLFKSDKYNVKYINFRGKAVYNYETFVNSMLFIDDNELSEDLKLYFNLGMFKIEYKIYEKIKKRQIDLFATLIEKLKKSTKQNILIIDEIQTLEELYINGEKEILKEFLNFCVRLTKELHLSHVVILSSNTIFINRIYNDAKLKVTSEFYRIDHFDYKCIGNWLEEEGFNSGEIELVWEYLGGCIPLIQRMMRDRKRFNNLREYLERQKWLAYTEIFMILKKENFNSREKNKFEEICRMILKDGYYMPQKDDEIDMKVIEAWSEKEVFFFDPMEIRVRGNNRLYEKGMEILLYGSRN